MSNGQTQIETNVKKKCALNTMKKNDEHEHWPKRHKLVSSYVLSLDLGYAIVHPSQVKINKQITQKNYILETFRMSKI